MSNRTLFTHEKTIFFTYILAFLTILMSPILFSIEVAKDLLGTATISIFFVLIPGYLIFNQLFKNLSLNEKIVFGSIALITLIIPIHAIFSKFNVSYISYIIITLSYLYFFNKKVFSHTKVKLDKFQLLIFIFITVIISMFILRQSLHIPLNNFDQYLVWPDSYNALAQTAEITNHGPEIYPFLASAQVPLNYHWGSFSLASFLSGAGVFALPISLFKTEFIFVSILIISALYLTGKSIAHSKLSGMFSVILGGLTLYPIFPEFNELIGLSRPQISTTSMPQLLSNLLLIGGIYFIYNYELLKFNKLIYSFILFLFTFSTTLSKGPNGVLLLIIITILVLLSFSKLKLIFLIIPSYLGFTIAYSIISAPVTVQGQSGMSLWLNPKNSLDLLLTSYNLNQTKINYLFFISLVAISFLSLFFAFIYIFKNKKLIIFSPLLIASFAGITGTFLLEAWGYSQFFLLYGAIPIIGIFLSSLVFYEKSNLDLNQITLFILGFGLQPIIFQIFSSFINKDSILKLYFSWILSTALLLIFTIFYSKILKLNIIYSFLVLSIGISSFSGLIKFDSKAYSEPLHPYSLTPGTSDVANFIKNNSSASDLIATNRHCAGLEELQDCTARQFGLSALSERRVFIEGWSYTTCPLTEAITNRYWKETDWKLNQDFFVDPSKNWDRFKKTGVKWLVVDQTRTFSEELNQIAELKLRSKDMSLWKIINPYEGPFPKIENPCDQSSNF